MVMRLPISPTACGFSAIENCAQTAIVRRNSWPGSRRYRRMAGKMIFDRAYGFSTGREARITEAGDTRFFAGWRSDPFFCDVEGAKNNFQFTGDDFFR